MPDFGMDGFAAWAREANGQDVVKRPHINQLRYEEIYKGRDGNWHYRYHLRDADQPVVVDFGRREQDARNWRRENIDGVN